MAENLENKISNFNGKDIKQLEMEGYKPLSNAPGYMFKADGKPRLYKLDSEKQLYFPVNESSTINH